MATKALVVDATERSAGDSLSNQGIELSVMEIESRRQQ
jgi:hypothetical protein